MSCSCKLFAAHLLFDVITGQINDDDDDDDDDDDEVLAFGNIV